MPIKRADVVCCGRCRVSLGIYNALSEEASGTAELDVRVTYSDRCIGGCNYGDRIDLLLDEMPYKKFARRPRPPGELDEIHEIPGDPREIIRDLAG